MKITYFRLKGYINILQGMGLEELIIPFDTFRSRIILIQGENGTGKSTILKALSPNPDSSDSFRTDVIPNGYNQPSIIEYPGEKEIRYEDDKGNQYTILIKSVVNESRTSRTTKAYISKNGEELNPNGNVSSFKDIRDDLLGIDPIYLDMSSISSENRGLVDMIPSERRKYLASYIGSLDTFNQIFKQISKKVNSTKSYLNTINSKMYNMGNESELRLRLIQMEDRKKVLSDDRDRLLKSLSEADTTVRLLDPENKIQDLYASISDELRLVKTDMEKNQQNLDRLHSKLGEIDEIDDFVKFRDNVENTLNKYKSDLDKTSSDITVNVSNSDILRKGIDDDTERLESISSTQIQSNIESTVKGLEDELNIYKEYLESDPNMKPILDKISLEDLQSLKMDLDTFRSIILSIDALYDIDMIKSTIDNCIKGDINSYTKELNILNGQLTEIQIKLVESKNTRAKLEKDLESIESFTDTRPKECKIDSCPYIREYVRLKETEPTLKKQLEEVIAEYEDLINQENQTMSGIETYNFSIELYNTLNPAISILISKKRLINMIPEISYLVTDTNKLAELISNHNMFNDLSVLDQYIEFASIYIKYKEVKEKYDSLTVDLKIYNNNKGLIDSLTKSIENKKQQLSEYEEKLRELVKSKDFLTGVITKYTEKLDIARQICDCLSLSDDLNNRRENIKAQYERIKDNIKTVKEKVDASNHIKNDIESIDHNLEALSEEINKLKYNLADIVKLQSDFETTSKEYEKLTFIKDACSPGNGMSIQSEYVKMYMNDIIYTCNTLLGYMFGGTLQLDMPVINEKQFSIPFIGPNGFTVYDISAGSTAQKCMIGLVFSCASMMKSSNTYNILRFDEIDGGLDTDNRRLFIQIVNQIMDIMRSKQCIMVSHNSEFDTENVTTIRLSHRGLTFDN